MMRFISEDYIKRKIQELLYNNNNFRNLTFNVPDPASRDFIKYEALKELIENDK